MNDNKKNVFEYTYSSPTEYEKRQIESIRQKYADESKTEPALERLKRFDAKVRNTANCVAIIFGVVGCLIFGTGLTMMLEWQMWTFGIIVMALGSLPMLLAYPAHNIAFKKGKKKYGDEILKLSDKLLNKE